MKTDEIAVVIEDSVGIGRYCRLCNQSFVRQGYAARNLVFFRILCRLRCMTFALLTVCRYRCLPLLVKETLTAV